MEDNAITAASESLLKEGKHETVQMHNEGEDDGDDDGDHRSVEETDSVDGTTMSQNLKGEKHVHIEEVEDDAEHVRQLGQIQSNKTSKTDDVTPSRGAPFQSCVQPARQQYRSILKTSKYANDDLLMESPRVDVRGNEIKPKRNGVKSFHGITFNNEKLQEVNVVENWKQFNTDATSEPGCGCMLI